MQKSVKKNLVSKGFWTPFERVNLTACGTSP